MKIAILCNDGSPLGVTMQSLYGEDGRIGVGGAELALLTMCEEWHKAGHEPVLFNDPINIYGSPFEQRGKEKFDPNEGWDEVIVFRSPNRRSLSFRGHKIWWSCDQFTVGDFKGFAPMVDKIVTISPFHAEYFQINYKITGTATIDLPVRMDDYEQELEKIPGRLIFTSVPDRGLGILFNAWQRIKKLVPTSSLVITSDYRLWGTTPGNEHYRMKFIYDNQVQFLGAVPRKRLVEEELKADVLAYPCNYDELFCIACSEAQVAGAFPITSNYGALRTTNMGRIIDGNPETAEWLVRFVNAIVEFLYQKDNSERNLVIQKAKERFHPKRILAEWDEKAFNG